MSSVDPFKASRLDELARELDDTFSQDQADLYESWKKKAAERAVEAAQRAEANKAKRAAMQETHSRSSCIVQPRSTANAGRRRKVTNWD